MEVAEAEAFSLGMGHLGAGTMEMMLFAHRNGVHEALGLTYPEWVEQYVDHRIKLAADERRMAAVRLIDDGLSHREAAAVLGVATRTIDRDVRESEEDEGTPGATNGAVDGETAAAISVGVATNGAESANGSGRWVDDTHVTYNSGDDGWYTPPEYIAAAVATLGAIDLDPASSEEANAVVGAARYYTAADDGLAHGWAGRVWLNPPYGHPWVERFCSRLVLEYEAGTVVAAVALVNNGTETAWFQSLCEAASALCFPRGRIRFWQPDAESRQPLQGQAVFYLGGDPDRFRAAFVRFGVVVARSSIGGAGWPARFATPRNSRSDGKENASPPPTSAAAGGTW